MKRWRIRSKMALIVLILLMLSVTGCFADQSPSNEADNHGEQAQSTQSATQYPLTIEDVTGESVVIPAEPKRIISLAPNVTEILFALGLEGKVVAVTKWDNYPPDVQDKVEYAFEDALNPNLEQIIRLNPDLILWSGISAHQVIQPIRQLGIPMVIFDPQNIEETYETIERVGVITNTQAKAEEIVGQMKAKEAMIKEKVAALSPDQKPRVWIEVDGELYTAGKGTFLNELLERAGGINIVEAQGWVRFNSEQVIAKNPDVIFVTYGYYDKDAIAKVLNRPGWENVEAVKNKKVIELDNDILNRAGPRIIDGLEQMAKALHPDLFEN